MEQSLTSKRKVLRRRCAINSTTLGPSGLTAITDAQAKSLSKFGRLSLNSLTAITDAQAESLGQPSEIYTEISHGKTTEYLQRIEQVSSKVKTQASSKLEGGDEWVESLTRAPGNRLKIRVRSRMPRVLQRVDGR